jgi:hypothetical protein
MTGLQQRRLQQRQLCLRQLLVLLLLLQWVQHLWEVLLLLPLPEGPQGTDHTSQHTRVCPGDLL